MDGVPIWVTVLGMLLAASPGLLAYIGGKRRDAAEARAKDKMAEVEHERVDVEGAKVAIEKDRSALEGMTNLVLRLEERMKLESEDCDRKIKDMEEKCQKCNRKLSQLEALIERRRIQEPFHGDERRGDG